MLSLLHYMQLMALAKRSWCLTATIFVGIHYRFGRERSTGRGSQLVHASHGLAFGVLISAVTLGSCPRGVLTIQTQSVCGNYHMCKLLSYSPAASADSDCIWSHSVRLISLLKEVEQRSLPRVWDLSNWSSQTLHAPCESFSSLTICCVRTSRFLLLGKIKFQT